MSRVRDGIVQRGRTWSYVIRVADPDTGRTRPRWVGGFATEREAKAARDLARVSARRGEYVDRSKITVAEYMTEWLDVHTVAVKATTASGYRTLTRLYVLPHIGAMKMQGVRPATITALYRELTRAGGRGGRPLAPGSVGHVHRMLHKAFADAVTVEQIITSNPVERATRPRSRRAEPKIIWTPGQLATFLDAAAPHRLFAFYRLAAYTGGRRGELLNVRWADLDLDAAEVTFTGSTAVLDGQRHDDSTKGGRSRVVSLDPGTVAVLREHRKRQAAERLAAGPGWVGAGEHLFVTETGAQVYPTTVTALMPEIAQSIALPHASPHDLRHLHATTLLLAGVPVHVVAARLGHADPSVTLRVYAHVLREQAAGVADVFANAVAGSC